MNVCVCVCLCVCLCVCVFVCVFVCLSGIEIRTFGSSSAKFCRDSPFG